MSLLIFFIVVILILAVILIARYRLPADGASSPTIDEPNSKVEVSSPNAKDIIDEVIINQSDVIDAEDIIDVEVDQIEPNLIYASKIRQMIGSHSSLLKTWRRDYKDQGIKLSFSQYLCRRTFEAIFDRKFQSDYRPNILKNPETQRNLEYDGYNDELKLAFEFNGRQHYNWPNHCSMTKNDYIKQYRRDDYKKRISQLHQIDLFIIPDTPELPIEQVPEWIAVKLEPKYDQYRCDLIAIEK
jgi:hypothetical protein